jgi:hypothetical protein
LKLLVALLGKWSPGTVSGVGVEKMIKVNQIGLDAIRAYLLEAHKQGASLTDDNINAWAMEAEKGERAQFELRAFEAVSGHTEVFDLPNEGFDLCLTLEEFVSWADQAKWTSVDDGQFGEQELNGDFDDEGNELVKPQGFGTIWRANSALHPSGKTITVTYQKDVSWVGTENARYTDEYKTSACFNDFTWKIEGVTLEDEDGYEESNRVVESWLDERDGVFGRYNDPAVFYVEMKNIDVASLIPNLTIEEIDLETDMDEALEELEIERDNEPNLRFRGKKLATARNSANNAARNYSGQTGRWMELTIWKTSSGKYVCQSIGYSQWQGEHTRYKAAVAIDEAGVIAFFGHGRLAKELYEEAGFDDVEIVD